MRLNTFWHTPQNAIYLDFGKTLVRNFIQEETIQLIKIIRICLIEIDQHIASLLDANSIIEHIVKREYEARSSRMNADVLRERIERVRKVCQTEMGLTFPVAQIKPYANSIGIRTA